MIKAICAILLGITVSSFAVGQGNGIKFTVFQTWDEIIKKASEENKFILIDCFTTWCAPCQQMSQNIFTRKEVGDFVNEKFISAKIQFDKTPKDDTSIRKWYKQSEIFSRQYNINSFPTILFLRLIGLFKN